MPATQTLEIDVSDVMKQATLNVNVRVRGVRMFGARAKAAGWMLRFTSWVLGCELDLTIERRGGSDE